MNCATVTSSTLSEFGRMDAGFYLGLVDGEDAQASVERAQRGVDRAVVRLKNAVTKATEASARTQRMIQEGKVVPY